MTEGKPEAQAQQPETRGKRSQEFMREFEAGNRQIEESLRDLALLNGEIPETEAPEGATSTATGSPPHIRRGLLRRALGRLPGRGAQ